MKENANYEDYTKYDWNISGNSDMYVVGTRSYKSGGVIKTNFKNQLIKRYQSGGSTDEEVRQAGLAATPGETKRPQTPNVQPEENTPHWYGEDMHMTNYFNDMVDRYNKLHNANLNASEIAKGINIEEGDLDDGIGGQTTLSTNNIVINRNNTDSNKYTYAHELNHAFRNYLVNNNLWKRNAATFVENPYLNEGYGKVSYPGSNSEAINENLAINASIRAAISADNGFVYGEKLDNIIKNMSNRELLGYIYDSSGYNVGNKYNVDNEIQISDDWKYVKGKQLYNQNATEEERNAYNAARNNFQNTYENPTRKNLKQRDTYESQMNDIMNPYIDQAEQDINSNSYVSPFNGKRYYNNSDETAMNIRRSLIKVGRKGLKIKKFQDGGETSTTPTLQEFIEQKCQEIRNSILENAKNLKAPITDGISRTEVITVEYPEYSPQYNQNEYYSISRSNIEDAFLRGKISKEERDRQLFYLDMSDYETYKEIGQLHLKEKRKSLLNGSTCINTLTGLGPHRVSGNRTFFDNPEKYGYIGVDSNDVQAGDLIQIFNEGIPHHAIMYTPKENGDSAYSYSNGGEKPESWKYQTDYDFGIKNGTASYARYRYVGTPEERAKWEQEYNEKYGTQQ